MRVSTIKPALMLCRAAGVTPFVWGFHGIGKSSVVKQLCAIYNLGFIDFRASQIEASDLRGLPEKENGRTVFYHPEDMPLGGMIYDEFVAALEKVPEEQRRALSNKLQPRLNNGILFLDELNRATDDVQQASFQLVLDKKVGLYTLPDGWSIICAGNYNEGDYITGGFNDAAYIDRFVHMQLSSGADTVEEWVDYMTAAHGDIASDIIEFAAQNVEHIDGTPKGELGFAVQPSKRSWEAVAFVKTAYLENPELYGERALTEVISGLVGRDLALAYQYYRCPVKPAELLERGVKAMASQLKKLERGQMIGLMWGLVSYIKPRIGEEKVGKVAKEFARFLCDTFSEKDLVIAFCRALIAKGTQIDSDAIRLAAITNPSVGALLKKVQKSSDKKDFLDYLSEDTELQKLVSDTAWAEN